MIIFKIIKQIARHYKHMSRNYATLPLRLPPRLHFMLGTPQSALGGRLLRNLSLPPKRKNKFFLEKMKK